MSPRERGGAIACFFFHIRDGCELIEDPDGLEPPDLATARDKCLRIVEGVLGQERWRDKQNADRKFEIVDELGRTVLVVPFTMLATTGLEAAPALSASRIRKRR